MLRSLGAISTLLIVSLPSCPAPHSSHQIQRPDQQHWAGPPSQQGGPLCQGKTLAPHSSMTLVFFWPLQLVFKLSATCLRFWGWGKGQRLRGCLGGVRRQDLECKAQSGSQRD